MKKILLTLALISSFLLYSGQALAGDRVKILMLEQSERPHLLQEAETIDKIEGKLYLNGEFHSGSFEIIRDSHGIYVIHKLSLTEYLQSAIASKMCRDWGIEEMMAQAVISRTYAEYHKKLNRGKKYHFASQLLPPRVAERTVSPLITYAIRETKGEILTYNEAPLNVIPETACKTGDHEYGLSDRNYRDILSDYFPGATLMDKEELYSQAISRGD